MAQAQAFTPLQANHDCAYSHNRAQLELCAHFVLRGRCTIMDCIKFKAHPEPHDTAALKLWAAEEVRALRLRAAEEVRAEKVDTLSTEGQVWNGSDCAQDITSVETLLLR